MSQQNPHASTLRSCGGGKQAAWRRKSDYAMLIGREGLPANRAERRAMERINRKLKTKEKSK